MLVRVTTDPLNELYVNTDAIRSVAFTKQDRTRPDPVYSYTNITHCYVDIEGHDPARPLEITEDAGRFLLVVMDANDAFVDSTSPSGAYFGGRIEPVSAYPSELTPRAPLTSRLAQCLRDTWQSVTLPQLAYMLHETESNLLDALQRLETEGVVLSHNDGQDVRYYHASQRAAYERATQIDCPECSGTGKQVSEGIIEGEGCVKVCFPCYFCEGTGKMIPAPAPVIANADPVDLVAIHARNCQQCTAALSDSDPQLELCGTGKFISEGLAEAKAKRNPDPLTAGEALLPDA